MADILSQEEIDALMDVIDYEGDDSFDKSEESFDPEHKIIRYDFKHSNRLCEEQLHTLHGIHEKMARSLASRISAIMRSNVKIRLHSVEQVDYDEFLLSLPNPTSFNLFSMKPLEGNGILEINPSIAFPMLDLLLGGKGECFKFNREFSEIELSLFETVLRMMTAVQKEAWGSVVSVDPVIESKESSPNILQIVARNESVVAAVMEIGIGQSSGMMNICYPVVALESLFSKLAEKDTMLNKSVPKESHNRELQVLLGDAHVNIEATLSHVELSMEELLALNKGDIIRLNMPASDVVSLSIDGKEHFQGEIGLHDYRKSIKITELTDKEQGPIND